MKVVADLHLHSRFSRAVSQKMTAPVISQWAKIKGIDLLGTSDFTHPIWYRELMANLKEEGGGLYKLKTEKKDSPLFLLSTELSSIYSQGGATRRIHTVVLAPSFNTVEKINKELLRRGVNLTSDGRPIMGMSAKDLTALILGVDERCLIIPAHIWTPWFSVFGSKSGFDSIKECFEEYSKYIYAIETGLSSDPAMNWRIGELENRRIVSFSDAHSPQKLGREATVFDLESLNFESVRKALMGGNKKNKILYTLEFYPEEGKYHFTGHRKCNVVYSPKEIKKLGTICPVCGKGLTVGVMNRVEALSSLDIETESKTNDFGVRFIRRKDGKHAPYAMMVPLMEIIAERFGVGPNTQKVLTEYERLTGAFKSEFDVLLRTDLKEIERVSDSKIANAIKKARSGDISINPGYDGVFGEVKIWKDEEEKSKKDEDIDQGALF